MHPASRLRQRSLHLAGLLVAAALGLPGVANAWWNQEYSYRKEITIDPAGAATTLSGALADVPVLVRLHDGNFNFAEANPDGVDIRFVAEDDQTPLKFHIEKYDSVFNLAAIWVRVPQLAPGVPAKVWLYYGSVKAVAGSEPQATYDPQTSLVWHFGERNQPPSDSTANAHTATNPAVTEDDGLVGAAAKLDGQAVIGLPAAPTLQWAAGSALTWSAWIKPAAKDADGTLFARREGARAFAVGFEKGVPYVEIADDAGVAQRTRAAAAIADTGWHHVAVDAADGQVTLYVDGKPAPALAAALPALTTAATLGGDPAATTPRFAGQIDELQIAKVARGASWIAVEVSNQGTEDKVSTFGADEQLSSWSTGYIGIILHSVTLDGWVIIIILMIMMLISFVIMWTKAQQISKVAKANRAFLKLFHKMGDDWGALSMVVDGRAAVAGVDLKEADRRALLKSPLLHMFNAGVDELQTRLTTRQNKGKSGPLSSRAIEAIRASLDSSLITETQSLNKLMVLLTIAISGGPFIGLLGTVVGVMITFAAIAASGDVNVNSIAPGIAAALAATVAGLMVAIPALFGYNYLISRIKEITTEMHVFLDAFVTRMAEGDDAAETLMEAAH